MVQVRNTRPTGPQAVAQSAAALPAPVFDAGQTAKVTPWPHGLNIALLIMGLGVGQGTIFVVQTWLVAKGRFELLSAFNTHYSFAILGIILTDGGASTILARETARLSDGHGATDEFWRLFCETTVFRLLTAALIGIASATYALALAPGGFSRCYLLCALPGLLFWAGNTAGLLDGLKMSGISGVTGSLAYAASAIALALVPDMSPEIAGSVLGGAFSAGYFLTVLAQWAALIRLGWTPQYKSITAAGLARSFRDGGTLLFQLLPGQIHYRVQLTLSVAFLGPEPTALFTYVKQIVTALTMVIAVVLRVDFPGLVQKVSRAGTRTFRGLIAAQRTTLYCAVGFTAGAIVVSSLSFMMPLSRFAAAAHMLLVFTPTILTISLSLMMMQAMIALGAYAASARITTISAAAGIAISCLLVKPIGVYAFLVGELVFHLVGCMMMNRAILRWNPLPKPNPECMDI
jgi:O-antigen/teichoic acid export membrane protein